MSVTNSQLIYSTYLGGSADDEGASVALDPSFHAYVTGQTLSCDFPTAAPPTTPGPYQTSADGGSCGCPNPCNGDAFVTKINPDPSLPPSQQKLYSTYLGSTSLDSGTGIAVDAVGDAYVTGFTRGGPFPTTTLAYQPSATSIFVSKLRPGGNGLADLLYSTGLGLDVADNEGRSIAVDHPLVTGPASPDHSHGSHAYVTGLLIVPGSLPTTSGAFQTFPDLLGPNPIQGPTFVSVIDPAGNGSADLLYSTYLGGHTCLSFPCTVGLSIGVDQFFNAYVTGFTEALDFPMAPPGGPNVNILNILTQQLGTFQPSYPGGGLKTAFLAKITPDATLQPQSTQLRYSTYLGGNVSDRGNGVAVQPCGRTYVAGDTDSSNFPVQPLSTYQGPPEGTPFFIDCSVSGPVCGDAFATKFLIGRPKLKGTFVSASPPGPWSFSSSTTVTVHILVTNVGCGVAEVPVTFNSITVGPVTGTGGVSFAGTTRRLPPLG